MTKIITKKTEYKLSPTYCVASPLQGKNIFDIKQLRDELELQGGAEVEVRRRNKDGSPAYRIDGEKTNYVIYDTVTKKYPGTELTLEAGANMTEFDTGLCLSHDQLVEKLNLINHIKKDMGKKFGLKEGPAWVTEQELDYDFVNPVHDRIMEIFKKNHEDVRETYQKILDLTEDQKHEYKLDITSPERIAYILSMQQKLPLHIVKLTQTTAQQLTLSSRSKDHGFSKTLWLYAQIHNYISEYYYIHHKSFKPRTDRRGKQFGEAVEYRSKHGLGVGGGNLPHTPGIKYHKYIKKRYFPNETRDNYQIGDMDEFVMGHSPKSLKFSIDTQGNLIPRTEFRLQDSKQNTLIAQRSIDKMLMDFVHSAYAQLPMWIYERV